MRCAKQIDPRVALMTWDEKNGNCNLNGDETKLITDESTMKYIDMSRMEGKIDAGEVYYGNGMRIQTEMNIDTFVEKWNNKKYDKTENTPFNNWKAVKKAEMQKHPVSYLIGYFAGTTERGYYDTVIKSLMEEFENEIEISFQSIYRPGVSTKVWKLARTMAVK